MSQIGTLLTTYDTEDVTVQNTFFSLNLTKQEYVRRMHKMFAYYGFIKCPLPLHRLAFLYANNVTEDCAYRIGCDVAAGYSFMASVRENR